MPAVTSRRDFLSGATAFAVAGCLPMPAFAAEARRLCFHHTHTGEKLDVTYFERGSYLDDALGAVNQLLRDHRSGEVYAMDTSLLDLLHAVQRRCERDGPFEVISGYRSPSTNEMLRRNSTGVAKRSLHTQGRAIDVRIPGLDTGDLRRAAMELSAGGVGYYPKSAFVHLDTGRVRAW
jgi:uncharacterized protein YcbK (DUF882 family)